MKTVEHRQVRAICGHVIKLAEMTKGTAYMEVLQQPVIRLRASLRKGQFRQAEDLAYGILMECKSLSNESSDEEAAENHETSKTPQISVRIAVNIGRSIKFVRVAVGIKQGEMAKRLAISQNYLSLLENNKAEPSLSLLKKMSTEFNVPVSFLILESSVEFESDNPDADSLLKQLQELIHQLQNARIKKGQVSTDGAGTVGG